MADLTFNELMTAHMDAVRAKSGVTGKLSIAAATEAVNGITSGGGGTGSSDVEYGYIDDSGNFQPLDLSGDTPVATGTAESMASLDMFKTGVNEPSYPSGGGSDGDSGITFYECASYTPNADAYTRTIMTLSGAADENANGTYVRTKWVEPPPEEQTDTPIAVWQNENGYRIEEFYYTEFNYTFYNASGESFCYSNAPYFTRVTDYSSIIWWNNDIGGDVYYNFSAWQTEEVPATTEGWTGYKMNWVDSSVVEITGDDILVSGNDNTFLNGTYSLSGEGSSRTWSLSIDDGMDKAIISYVTDAVYGDLYPGWTLRLESSAESYYTNTEAGADASITEICTGTWQKDLAGSSTIPTFGVETTETSVPAHWERSDTLTEDLTVKGYTPVVGKIYDQDATILVTSMYAD